MISFENVSFCVDRQESSRAAPEKKYRRPLSGLFKSFLKKFSYGGPRQKSLCSILQNISFDLEAGQVLALVGESGSGKTSLLRLLAGFERVSSGQISIGGTVVESTELSSPAEKRKVGFVFQDFGLFPHLTVEANVSFGLSKLSKVDQLNRVDEVLSLTGLSEFRSRYPHELSGGQQQRVALARSMAPRPDIILMDEPFSSLDQDLAQRLVGEIRDILKRSHMTAIVVTHNQKEAFAIGDQIAVMENGQITAMGDCEKIYYEPPTLSVANFLGEGSLLSIRSFEKKTSLGEEVQIIFHTDLGSVSLDQCEGEKLDLEILESLKSDDFPYKIFIRPEHIELGTKGVSLEKCRFELGGCVPLVKGTTSGGDTLTFVGSERLMKSRSKLALSLERPVMLLKNIF